jgi:hypothetical protein
MQHDIFSIEQENQMHFTSLYCFRIQVCLHFLPPCMFPDSSHLKCSDIHQSPHDNERQYKRRQQQWQTLKNNNNNNNKTPVNANTRTQQTPNSNSLNHNTKSRTQISVYPSIIAQNQVISVQNYFSPFSLSQAPIRTYP